MHSSPRLPQLVTGAVLAVLAVGCFSTKPKKQSELMKSAKDVTFAFTAEELRLLMRDAVGPITGDIEATADQIAASTTNPAVRRAALDWKLEAMPAFREALFRSDPIAAILDSLALTLQMEEYFETGGGRDQFGDLQPLAIERCRSIEQDHLALLDEIVRTGSTDRAVEMIRGWARDNPIRASIASRDSILSAVGMIERQSGTSSGLASGIGVTLDDVVRRVEIYSDQIPRQARWQAERLIIDLVDSLDAEATLAELPELIATIKRVAQTVEELETLVARERSLVLSDVERQRLETLEFVAARMEEVLEFVSAERLLVVDDVKAERILTIEEVREEIRWIATTLREERELTVNQTDELIARHLDGTLDRVEGFVDRLLLKVGFLLAVVLVVVAILTLIVVRSVRRPA